MLDFLQVKLDACLVIDGESLQVSPAIPLSSNTPTDLEYLC
jgi:hypothetical protein